MAEGVFRSVAASHPLIGEIDSSGTAAYHAGEPPDIRTLNTLRRHGISNYQHLAQRINVDHFLKNDYIIAMDDWNLSDLLREKERVSASLSKASSSQTPSTGRAATTTRSGSASALADAASKTNSVAEVRLFGDFLPGGKLHERVGGGPAVQDPYYGGAQGFETVYGQVMQFSKNFLQYLERLHAGESQD